MVIRAWHRKGKHRWAANEGVASHLPAEKGEMEVQKVDGCQPNKNHDLLLSSRIRPNFFILIDFTF